ncbi:uracil-DNA glycosylase [Desulfatitalea alkaliphila]|uniref:Type-4 uracil-DNA glycosylase n=1 Tax=Desulfatitalea alkaliphila TaxID=2929485 RepID=A0AA41ULM0_9BACT|nr:uracil-DNA glycosylase [Desulfatitalea alkaliphila]MCJ8502557.1 uracil-DNA glycosylase [Desulfatitalea alkaliphila]
MQIPETMNDTLTALRDTLVQLERWGCRGFDCNPRSIALSEGWLRSAAEGPKSAAVKPPGADVKPAGENLAHIQADLGDCRRCGLSAGRTHLVFGEGDPKARLMFVGEAPGGEEDRSGRPFVGNAGRLLTRIIAAMGLTREEVYICNVIKCRPPGNRNPAPEEIAACLPFLERQIRAVAPEVICALGTFAARALLESPLPISRLRGRFHDRHGIKVMPTFHPAYLLHNPDQKRAVWDDVQKIMALLRLPR